jgi:hypothetical protein
MEDKGYLFEAAVGKGVLMACSMNLGMVCRRDPAATYLLQALATYLLSGECAPVATIGGEQLRAVYRR